MNKTNIRDHLGLIICQLREAGKGLVGDEDFLNVPVTINASVCVNVGFDKQDLDNMTIETLGNTLMLHFGQHPVHGETFDFLFDQLKLHEITSDSGAVKVPEKNWPLSTKDQELAKWNDVFGHLGKTPDEIGNLLISVSNEKDAAIKDRDNALDAMREIFQSIKDQYEEFGNIVQLCDKGLTIAANKLNTTKSSTEPPVVLKDDDQVPSSEIAKIEQTQWAARLKSEAPSLYHKTIRLAVKTKKVVISQRDDHGPKGEFLWVITPEGDDDYWLDALSTKDQAISVCQEVGWAIV